MSSSYVSYIKKRLVEQGLIDYKYRRKKSQKDTSKYDTKNESDKLERLRELVYNGNIDNDVQRRKLFYAIKEYIAKGKKIEDRDWLYLRDCIECGNDYWDKDVYRVILMKLIKEKKFQEAKRFTNICIRTYKGSSVENSLKEYLEFLKYEHKKYQVITLHSSHVDHTEIAQKLDLRETEVLKIIREYENKREFEK